MMSRADSWRSKWPPTVLTELHVIGVGASPCKTFQTPFYVPFLYRVSSAWECVVSGAAGSLWSIYYASWTDTTVCGTLWPFFTPSVRSSYCGLARSLVRDGGVVDRLITAARQRHIFSPFYPLVHLADRRGTITIYLYSFTVSVIRCRQDSLHSITDRDCLTQSQTVYFPHACRSKFCTW